MLFLGPLFNRQEEVEVKNLSRCGLPNSDNTFEWALIKGLNQQIRENISIINVLPVGIFPRQFKKLILPNKKWTGENGSDNIEVGCLNLPVIKQYMRYSRIRKILQKSKDKNIFIYSVYYPFLKAIRYLPPEYHITLLVTDLPEFADLGKTSKLRKSLRSYIIANTHKCLKRVDRFVLLTEQMKIPLHVGTRPYVVVEGIAKNELPSPEYSDCPEEKVIFYGGALNKIFGIVPLLDAFSMIKDPSYRLQLCGVGDAVSEIQERAKVDSRIQYMGYVTKAQADSLQRKATVLVNPRVASDEYTKYSFPSKTIEYMSTGVPVVMYKLPGIPEEYDEFLNYVDNESVESLRDTIVEICEMSESARREIGMRAFNFILKEKNSQKQAKKIINMMENKQK